MAQVGGGNFFRGVDRWDGLDRATADYVGMLATVRGCLDSLRRTRACGQLGRRVGGWAGGRAGGRAVCVHAGAGGTLGMGGRAGTGEQAGLRERASLAGAVRQGRQLEGGALPAAPCARPEESWSRAPGREDHGASRPQGLAMLSTQGAPSFPLLHPHRS